MKRESVKMALFEEIYKDTIRIVYKTALNYSGNDEGAAQEIVQNTYLQLYIYLESMKFDNIKAWLITTAKNDAINCYKKIDREIPDDKIFEMVEEIEYNESAEVEFLNNLENEKRKNLRDDIFERMYEMNPVWYHAVTLVYCMEVPQKEVAKEMNISIQVLHSMLFRARQWIKRKYGHRYKDMDEVENKSR